MSVSGSVPKNLVPVSRSSSVKFHERGEVVAGEFRGQPWVAVYHPGKGLGSAVMLSRANLESDIRQWLRSMSALVSRSEQSQFETKVLCWRSDEAKLAKLLTEGGFKPRMIFTLAEGEKRDCFFHSDSGRFRIGPHGTSLPKFIPEPSEPVASHRSGELSAKPAPEPERKMRVLVVDDSSTIRGLLKRIINASPLLEVVAEVDRPSLVEGMIRQHKPDVVTLDINMPEMSGVELLRKLLAKDFIPAVMISSLSIDEGKEVLDALEIGAVDYIHKPAAAEIAAMTPLIQEKIHSAAKSKRRKAKTIAKASSARAAKAPVVMASSFQQVPLLAVGASTGGTEAIKEVFVNLPADIPPTLIVQHIPPLFSAAFANRLNEICAFEVREAKDGDELKRGLALVAPGGLHLEVVRKGRKFYAKVYDAEPVNRFKPSVDVLFSSVASVVGGAAVGVILTGMGSDGAKGLLEMKKAGSFTIAQNEESCVVYGMPRAAVEMGAVTLVESLDRIHEVLVSARAA
jgi:two-component system, chemotaxis family, protein-glutamate methylesterase/glutaminase